MSDMINFENFTFKYNSLSKPTLKNINLKIKRGEKVLIAGPSGSGKSTLGHCLNGLIPSAYKGSIEGKLTVDGVEPHTKSIFDLSSHVGTVLQDQDGQFVGLTVGEDVAFIDENKNISQEEMRSHVREALELVDMTDHERKSPHELSGGQKQSISLAGIMMTDASVLLFDEPLANLDPASGKKAMQLISDIHRKTDRTIVVIEHRIEDVLEADFDRVVIVNDGRIVANGTPEELLMGDDFRKNGLREPLYIEALKYAGVSLDNRIERGLHKLKPEDISALKKWTASVAEPQEGVKEPLLVVEDLTFSYSEGERILSGINLHIFKGEIVALLGNNGAGKSTLSKVITGIVRGKGKISLENSSIDKWSIRRRGEKIGYVMQNPNHMLTQETLLEEVEFGLKIRKVKNSREKAEKALFTCGLHRYRNWPVSALSYGQKKRLSIAAILSLDPEILILDEPTAGQDHKHYLEFMEFIREIAASGVGILLITHDMHLALEYARRAVVLSKGEVIADREVSSILGDREIMERANLKETSLSLLAERAGICSTELMNTFINYEHREEVHHG